jgi:hypothetical protein
LAIQKEPGKSLSFGIVTAPKLVKIELNQEYLLFQWQGGGDSSPHLPDENDPSEYVSQI